MDRELIERVSQRRPGDSAEIAEMRAWLAKQPKQEWWGLTPATRVAHLLDTVDTLRAELQRSLR